MLLSVQIEEDTDRDRYMSPLEAKNYGLIDEVIGGDEAGFQITGTTRDFPKTKEAYVNWVSLHVELHVHEACEASLTAMLHKAQMLFKDCVYIRVLAMCRISPQKQYTA